MATVRELLAAAFPRFEDVEDYASPFKDRTPGGVVRRLEAILANPIGFGNRMVDSNSPGGYSMGEVWVSTGGADVPAVTVEYGPKGARSHGNLYLWEPYNLPDRLGLDVLRRYPTTLEIRGWLFERHLALLEPAVVKLLRAIEETGEDLSGFEDRLAEICGLVDSFRARFEEKWVVKEDEATRLRARYGQLKGWFDGLFGYGDGKSPPGDTGRQIRDDLFFAESFSEKSPPQWGQVRRYLGRAEKRLVEMAGCSFAEWQAEQNLLASAKGEVDRQLAELLAYCPVCGDPMDHRLPEGGDEEYVCEGNHQFLVWYDDALRTQRLIEVRAPSGGLVAVAEAFGNRGHYRWEVRVRMTTHRDNEVWWDGVSCEGELEVSDLGRVYAQMSLEEIESGIRGLRRRIARVPEGYAHDDERWRLQRQIEALE